jgi:preflagellin peptidase FlaK
VSKEESIFILHRLGTDMEWTVILKMTIAMVVLIAAAVADWRTREASDRFWMIIGVAGMVFLAWQIVQDGADLLYLLILVPIGLFFGDIFWEREGLLENGINLLAMALYGVGLTILGIMVLMYYDDLYFWELMIVPIMFLVFILLYQFDVIKGGADAKALIALSIMFPTYPVAGPFPLIPVPFETAQFVLPFPLLILFNAALLTITVPAVLLAYNATKGRFRVPAMLFGYPLPVTDAKNKFVWPMERVEDGEIKFSVFPAPSEDIPGDLDMLSAAGLKEVWVTPKIPFLIPITASLLFSFIVGNLLFLLMW